MSIESADALEFAVRRNPEPTTPQRRAAALESPRLGAAFTDHMVTIRWTAEKGWHAARVEPRRPVRADLTMAALHYGQSIFEGLKAFPRPDGEVALFRTVDHGHRMAASARRMALPELPVADFVAAAESLVGIDRHWVPRQEGASLYLRPLMYASEAFLGVRPAAEVTFAVFATPALAHPWPATGAISIWASPLHTRAAPGGTGAAKCAGNYAAGLAAQQEARARGCDQVLFLDAAEHRMVEELTSMNIFCVRADGTVATPRLGGTILGGITRDSILRLAADLGRPTAEQDIHIDQWCDEIATGQVEEVFACGTAAGVVPVGQLSWRGRRLKVGDGRPGEVTLRLGAELSAVQYGHALDRHGWTRVVS